MWRRETTEIRQSEIMSEIYVCIYSCVCVCARAGVYVYNTDVFDFKLFLLQSLSPLPTRLYIVNRLKQIFVRF